MKIGGLNRSIGEGSKIGLALELDFKHLDGNAFMSRDVYGHLCTNHGSKWQLDGRYFDGVGNYVDLGSPATLKPPYFTIVAWFKTTKATTSDHGDNIYRYISYGQELAINRTFAGAGRVSAMYYDSKAVEHQVASVNAYNDGLRYFTAMTFDGSYLKLYVDSEVQSLPTTASIYYGSGAAAIGRAGDWDGNYFKGLIAEVRIYNRILAAKEVSFHHNLLKPLFQ